MRRRLALFVALALSIVVSVPAQADFSRVAVGLRKLGFERTWIPFLGFARAMVRVVAPNGVHDFQLAVYENTPDVSPADLERMVATHVGRQWSPLVRVRSQKKGESVFVYARPSRDERIVELLVLAHERGETVLVRLVADTQIVAREFGNPVEIRRMASR
ncbi:MAG TPA: DUF4252 domain-containing protein [Thermoanaerobaculia bacterium]